MQKLRQNNALLGVAAFGPCIALVWGVVTVFAARFIQRVMHGSAGDILATGLFWTNFVLLPAGCVACVMAWIVCLHHLDQQKLAPRKSLVWKMLLSLWVIGVPIYWVRFIKPKSRA